MHNHRVLLLERERFPRYQIGESLLPSTIHGICVLLGIEEQIKRAGFVRKNGGTFLWGKSPEPWTFGFGITPFLGESSGYAYQVERAKFDDILLNNARHKGVDVRENHTVTGLVTENGRIAGVEFTNDRGERGMARGRFVADASGHQTILSRAVGERHFSKFFQNVALFCYFENGKRLPPPNNGNILCASFKYGWFWYIPLSPTLTSVGAVIDREHADVLKNGHESAMASFIEACPVIKEYLAGAKRVTDGLYGKFRVRKDYSYIHSRFWAPGIVLVGDAACFIDPVFSSGVHLATYSALLAARSINTVLSGDIDEKRCFQEFEMRYRHEYSNFYRFLLAFYDVHQDEESYFWEARKILNTEERANEAFVRLVAGVSTWNQASFPGAAAYLEQRADLGTLFQPIDERSVSPVAREPELNQEPFMSDLLAEIAHVQSVASMGARRAGELPKFAGGLLPSADGLRWQEG
jgi:halogenation protein CepH